jgi:hypothetical protein
VSRRTGTGTAIQGWGQPTAYEYRIIGLPYVLTRCEDGTWAVQHREYRPIGQHLGTPYNAHTTVRVLLSPASERS